jgi:hypothetical protein
MAAIQVGYGHSDSVGLPFDFYGTSTVAGTIVNMQTAKLVFDLGGAVTFTNTITFPLNPSDGADLEISNMVGSGGTLTLAGTAVTANTGDSILGTAPTTVAAGVTLRYRYSLAGDILKGFAPRTWIRIA